VLTGLFSIKLTCLPPSLAQPEMVNDFSGKLQAVRAESHGHERPYTEP
jgi:hypothetical protein